jgi:hypothetical protein
MIRKVRMTETRISETAPSGGVETIGKSTKCNLTARLATKVLVRLREASRLY